VLKGAEVTLLDDQETVIAEFTVPGVGFVDGYRRRPGWRDFDDADPVGSGATGPLYLVDAGLGETPRADHRAALRYPIYTCVLLITYPQDAADPHRSPPTSASAATRTTTRCLATSARTTTSTAGAARRPIRLPDPGG
jgi:hypothetical protein